MVDSIVFAEVRLGISYSSSAVRASFHNTLLVLAIQLHPSGLRVLDGRLSTSLLGKLLNTLSFSSRGIYGPTLPTTVRYVRHCSKNPSGTPSM